MSSVTHPFQCTPQSSSSRAAPGHSVMRRCLLTPLQRGGRTREGVCTWRFLHAESRASSIQIHLTYPRCITINTHTHRNLLMLLLCKDAIKCSPSTQAHRLRGSARSVEDIAREGSFWDKMCISPSISPVKCTVWRINQKAYPDSAQSRIGPPAKKHRRQRSPHPTRDRSRWQWLNATTPCTLQYGMRPSWTSGSALLSSTELTTM